MLAQVIEAEHPDRIGIAFDVKGAHSATNCWSIQGNARSGAAELLSQLPLIRQALAHWAYGTEQPGYEGDDDRHLGHHG